MLSDPQLRADYDASLTRLPESCSAADAARVFAAAVKPLTQQQYLARFHSLILTVSGLTTDG